MLRKNDIFAMKSVRIQTVDNALYGDEMQDTTKMLEIDRSFTEGTNLHSKTMHYRTDVSK